jgi:serine/threonine-protein kinase
MKAATDRNRRPTPRTRGANIPDEIEAVCRRALAVDPGERFASIGELWSALVAARDGVRGGTTMQAPVVAPAAITPSSGVAPPSALAPAPPATPRAMTAVPISAPMPASMQMTGPPLGTRPPGHMPPSHVPLPGYHGPMPYAASPPPGTLPPGQRPRPFVRADGTSPVVPITIVLFVLALLLAASCAVGHAACSAV